MSNSWYPHYPGDYGRDTAHLSLVEHGAYRLLLDHYYATSAALPADPTALYRICRAFDGTERKAVDSILRQFFNLQADGYHNPRADIELVRRAEQHDRLSRSGQRGAQKRWKYGPANGPAIASPQPQPQPQKEKTKPCAAKPAAPTDPRFQPFVDFAYRSFEAKHGQKPTWRKKDFNGLKALLGQSQHLTQAEFERRWNHYSASTEPFTVKQGDSLAYFCSRFDPFINGPILAGKGNSNGKLKGTELALHNEAGLFGNRKPN